MVMGGLNLIFQRFRSKYFLSRPVCPRKPYCVSLIGCLISITGKEMLTW